MLPAQPPSVVAHGEGLMALLDQSLKNPQAVGAVLAIAMLFGVLSLFKFPVQLLPDIDRPQLSISTQWRTASSREVESEVIEPQEDVLSGLPGLIAMRSSAFNASGFLNLEFEFGTNMQETLVEVISRLNRVQGFPDDADPPVVELGENNTLGSGKALSWFYVQLQPDNVGSIDDYVPIIEDVVRPKLESVPGVASVYMSAGEVDELRVQFDPYRAAELGISVGDMASHVGSANDVSGGFASVGRREYTIRFAGKASPQELGELILDWRDGKPVFLRDVADVHITRSDRRSFVYQNGNPGIALRVDRQPGANVLEALSRVKAVFAELDETVLAKNGLTVDQSFDPSVFIYRAITLVTSNIVLGALLAIGILWWFLRNLRATLLIALSIPCSLFITSLVLNLGGRTLNIISLAGVAFAVGMVLDAAIVVLENIVRLRKKDPAETAAANGTKQVWGALLASTATTVAIFVPVVFIPDVEGQLFADLALTISVAVTVSLMVAVLVLPAMSVRFLGGKSTASETRDPHASLWQTLARRITQLTDKPKRRAVIISVLMLAPLGLTALLMPSLDYLPPVKRDVVEGYLNFPAGATIDSIDNNIVAQVNEKIHPYYLGEKTPKVDNYYVYVSGTWGAQIGARLEDQERVDELVSIMRSEVVAELLDTQAFVQQGNLFGNFDGGRQVVLHLQARDQRDLATAAAAVQQAVTDALPGVNIRIEPPLQLSQPELRLLPKNRALAETGWSRRDFAATVRALGSGLYIGEYFDGDVRMDIMVRSSLWDTPEQLGSTPLYSPNGEVIQLDQLADVERTVGPSQVYRMDGRRTIDMAIAVPERVSLQDYIATIKEVVDPVASAKLPADGNVKYGGSASKLSDAIRTMGSNFALALFILFVLMAALFKSLRDSLLVILTVPLATVGSVVFLRLINLVTFQPVDLLTMIGFVILLGLVVNNAILLVHQTRQGEAGGLSRRDAVEQAIELRVRPIMMSTLTSIFGMLPLLLSPGAGSLIYRGLAGAIVGGMSVSMIFTLILLPALLRLGATKPITYANPPLAGAHNE